RGPFDDPSPVVFIIGLVAGLLFLTAQALLSAFWYRLGHYLGDGGSARLALGSMISWLVAQVVFPVVIIILVLVASAPRAFGGPPPTAIAALIALGVWIVVDIILLCLFLAVCSRLRASIRGGAARLGY